MIGDFWHVATKYFWRPELPWALAFTLTLGGLLFTLLRDDRRMIINSLELYGFCVFGKFVSACVQAFGLHGGAEIIHEIFVVGSGLIMIYLCGLLLFRLVFPLIRLRAPRIVEDLLLFVAYVAWILVRLRLAGMDLGSLVATSALVTAVVAFAMQDTLGNTMGGLLLQLESSLKPGDWITVGAFSGQISEIRWRYTAIETRDGETVVLPNSFLMKNAFAVTSSPSQKRPEWRRWLWFNVHSSVPPGRVIGIAVAAVAGGEIPNVASEPEPSCVLMEFGSGYARYALRYWLLDAGPDAPTDSLVRMRVFAAFQRVGLDFALAEQTVNMRVDSEPRQARRQSDEQKRRWSMLRATELFAGLSDDELVPLAAELVQAPFAHGEVILRQGVIGDALYVVAEGAVDVWVERGDQPRRLVMTLGPGEILGELGMMTGEPRRATLVARGYALCYQLRKAVFERLIQSRPEWAERIAAVLAKRERQLANGLPEGQVQPLTEIGARAQNILGKMRKLLGFR